MKKLKGLRKNQIFVQWTQFKSRDWKKTNIENSARVGNLKQQNACKRVPVWWGFKDDLKSYFKMS